MRLQRSVILGLTAVLWMGAAMAQEAGSEPTEPVVVQEVPVAPTPEPVVAPAPVAATPQPTWTPPQPVVQTGGDSVRLGTIQVSEARDHASYLSTPFGTIMPPAEQRALQSASSDAAAAPQLRWGNLHHLTGATYGSAVRLDLADFERKTALDLWQALKSEPGIRLEQSGRRSSEGTISIRGSSRYQVGMYIDDVPIATAWRNEFDASNYLLYNLASIEVTKGFSSPLLGTSNGLAGVINMRTAKPTEKIEAVARYMNFFDRDMNDQGRMVAASFGTKQEKFYLKLSGILNEQDYFMLPSDYTPGTFQLDGRRNNYNTRNRSLNFVAGWTPNDRVDIMFGMVQQLYKKNYVVDAGDFSGGGLTNNQRYVWDFPDYKTQRYYVNANFQLTDKLHLKAVAYYDHHIDRSNAVEASTGLISSWASPTWYDQYQAGGLLRADYTFNDKHQFSASVGYRRLSHKEDTDYAKVNNPPYVDGLRTRKVEEDYLDLGGEYTFRPIEPLAFVLGGSYNRVKPKELGQYNESTGQWDNLKTGALSESDHLTSWQVGVFYDITENHQVYGTFAKKARFATMRERYNRNNQAGSIVDPEHVDHYELGYRGIFCDWLEINSNLFYSDYTDKIQMSGSNPTTNLNGSVKMYGFELSAEAIFNDCIRVGANFTAMKWKNHADTSYITNTPNVAGSLYAVIQPIEKLSIIPQVDMTGHFYRDSSNSATSGYKINGTYKSAGFVTADLKVVYDVNKHFTVEAGARNIFDKEYAYAAYYPQEGRNFFVGITAKW